MDNPLWVPAWNDEVPQDAVPLGHEADGTPLYVARAYFAGGLHIGKVRRGFGAANIPYAGEEVKVNPYEVLYAIGDLFYWAEGRNGYLPYGAIAMGREQDGTRLYVARAEYAGGLHVGKVRPPYVAAEIPYGGKEIAVTPYEVLVRKEY